MPRKPTAPARREDSLTRDRIIEAAIELLDTAGEDGLTFRALSQKLATGPGAIYWHVANKSDLLTAACDALIIRTVDSCAIGKTPQTTIRTLALAMYDIIDEHPWVGSALYSPEGQMPIVRVLESIGQAVRALGINGKSQWSTVGTLLNYILGVGGRNAANGQLARNRGLDRDDFLETVATMWSQLDPAQYPFTRSAASQVRGHDDRVDFLAGIDLILRGITTPRR